MINPSKYNITDISAHSQLGKPYLEFQCANQDEAEKLYEDLKASGFEVPKDLDLKMDNDESLGLRTVQLTLDAMLELETTP